MANNTGNKAYDFNSGGLLVFLYKWRKPLIIISLFGAIVSAIVSLIIPNKYESKVVLFPASINSISKALISENNIKADVLEFGEEEQAEQLLQILHSDEIRDRVITKFNLLEHYDIEKDDEFKMTKLHKKYKGNVTFKRTEFMSVEINVLDESPDTAALMANFIANHLDSVKNRMRYQIAYPAYKIVEEQYLNLQSEIQELEDSLTKLRKMGINDYESQAEVFNQQLAIALSKNNSQGVKLLEDKLKVLETYGGAYVGIRDYLDYLRKQLSHVKSKYNEAKIDAEKQLEHKFVVNWASPAEKKSYPIRWLIVAVSTLSTFMLTFFILLIKESFREIKFESE